MTSARQVLPDSLKLRYHGLMRAISGVLDRALRVETAGRVNLDDLGLAHPERVGYEAGNWLDLPRALRGSEITREDVFLDLGCGKGRALLMASLYPFRRVTGVELSAELAAAAVRNLKSFRPRTRCRRVEVVVADASNYRVADDVSVAYLYNPFRDETFDRAIANLIASIDRNPRRVRLIYKNALYEDRLLATGRARRVRVVSGLRPGRQWRQAVGVHVYILEPESHRPAPA
jgi:SAM-dependent methyltransferase